MNLILVSVIAVHQVQFNKTENVAQASIHFLLYLSEVTKML